MNICFIYCSHDVKRISTNKTKLLLNKMPTLSLINPLNKIMVALKRSQRERGMWKDRMLVVPDFSDDYELDSSCDLGLRGIHRLRVTLRGVLPSHEQLTQRTVKDSRGDANYNQKQALCKREEQSKAVC